MTGATRAALIAQATAALTTAGVASPDRDARVLLRAASGLSPAQFSISLGAAAEAAEAARFAGYLAARIARQPVAQILGERAFWGRDFIVTPDVLDPRPDTETLIEAALARGPRRRVLDLGTGSGAILLTLLGAWPQATGLGADASPAALEVAAANAARHGMQARAAFAPSDWFEGVAGLFDCIACNPPYVSEAAFATLDPEVRMWEPRAALTPGGDGLAAYRSLAAGLSRHLAPGGIALFEIGADQGSTVRDIFSAAGHAVCGPIPDLNGRARVILVQG